MFLTLLFGVFLCTLIGVALGIITGLVPGIHVNTVATLILIFSPAFMGFVLLVSSPLGVSAGYAVVLVSAMIVGNLITHTFLDFIPSALFGAPDEDMALSVLPAHRLVLRGDGDKAIKLSASGSLYAVLIGLVLLIPAYVFFGILDGYGRLEPYIPYMLILVVSVLIAEESVKGRKYSLYALLIFIMSGIFGWVVLNGDIFQSSPAVFPGMEESAPIFAGLLGLFGFPALIQSMGLFGTLSPGNEEKGGGDDGGMFRNSLLGTVSGAFVGWFPGITSASATVLASNLSDKNDSEGFITTMSAVNTSNAVFVILALFVIGKARSGALKVVQGLLHPGLWSNPANPPSLIFLLLFSVVLSAAIAYPLTIYSGKFFLKRLEKVEYRRMSMIIIVFLVLLCIVLAGPLGVYVASVGAMIGLIPPLIGINRVHLMGFLIIPVILYLGVSM